MNIQIQTNASDPIQPGMIEPKLYPPSFLDRFMKAVERLPVPYWLTYLALFILESAIFHILSWIDGWLPAYTVNPLLLLFPLWLWGPLAIITYLNSISLGALASFAPLLNIQEESMQRLKNEFTTMPTRSVIISGVMWAIVYFIFTWVALQTFYGDYKIGTLLTVLIIIEGLVSYSTGSIIYYHSIRQLILVNRTLQLVKRFNLFQLDPVYAFSLVTARTGMAWMILLSLTLLTFPIQLAPIPILVLLSLQLVLAISAFVLPLQIVHHRLVLEKRRLWAEVNQRVESATAQLHQRLDENDLSKMIELDHAIMGLNAERDILAKISTWPWRSGLLTGFLSITILPIILFLVQLALG
ncbi:MAG TPA: hypothetical protein VFF70_15025, partial [Anaerolineae bacterium]|nr:hypothetical protein [Anaerolineae bacterium]